jgi:hypothetical protein
MSKYEISAHSLPRWRKLKELLDAMIGRQFQSLFVCAVNTKLFSLQIYKELTSCNATSDTESCYVKRIHSKVENLPLVDSNDPNIPVRSAKWMNENEKYQYSEILSMLTARFTINIFLNITSLCPKLQVAAEFDIFVYKYYSHILQYSSLIRT